MKYVYIISLSILCSMVSKAMDMSKMPSDMRKLIASHITFPLSDLHDDKKKSICAKDLSRIAQKLIDLRCVCADFNASISQNFISALGLNKDDMNIFLIRSLQANIPYLIKGALANGASRNAIHKPSGWTALLYATEQNNYYACKLLLDKGADINLKQQYNNKATLYKFRLEYPMHMAVKKGDAKLVGLFIEKGVYLKLRYGQPDYGLLSEAMETNNWEIFNLLTNHTTNECHDHKTKNYKLPL